MAFLGISGLDSARSGAASADGPARPGAARAARGADPGRARAADFWGCSPLNLRMVGGLEHDFYDFP